ncbi:hypothetical protein BDV25DRAFT_157694 [Aspergillus avenaceus]|uniref:Zn(2)-C6 fungal-type domain-containing protein n=1 Tax=Aspergillus avenaceus TaxID=36643 RepID=A0A5N6TRG4_ASPAV|nr:hypothetical protein BDV25DRAFT_157694 [Aspergillus avenaceus]
MVVSPHKSMMPRESTRGRLRSHEACLNCRRKKTRCPAERPSCSNCLRLNQPCLYSPARRTSRGGQSEDRLASLEEKVNLILSGSRPVQGARPEKREELHDIPEVGYSKNSNPSSGDPSYDQISPGSGSVSLGFGNDDSNSQPSSATVSRGVELYFHYCNRQPIWCFDYEDLEDKGCLSDELVYSILALTARFSPKPWESQRYGSTARTLIMLRVANGTVDLETIESLCLLSYSSFIDGDVQLGRFHLGLAFQLCRSAMMDYESAYPSESPFTERKKRLFWSLQSLEQTYGQQNGFLSLPAEILRPFHGPPGAWQKDAESKLPPLPRDDIGCSTPTDIGIWSLALHFGWVWSRVRTYVSDCAQNRLKEPWRHDSMYAMVISDLTEVENKLSQCHRYDSVKFYERTADELRKNRAYWTPWLKLQFTYHCILTVLNHPFLYIVASQSNPNLSIPNAFWRRSSELVLLHATWLVRMIDMVSEKKMRLIDPFFGHAAAIAATVHLYYCCAVDPRLKQKSKIDFDKCRTFLKSFVPFSVACRILDQTLDKMTRIASGSEKVDYEWMPSRIHLSIPLMWDILQVNCTPESPETSTGGLLHPSLVPVISREEAGESSCTLEVIVAMSPEVTVNTADGGQAAHMQPQPRVSKINSAPSTPGSLALAEKLVAPADSLMMNTPWLWTGQFPDVESVDFQDTESSMGNVDGFSSWWDFGNL